MSGSARVEISDVAKKAATLDPHRRQDGIFNPRLFLSLLSFRPLPTLMSVFSSNNSDRAACLRPLGRSLWSDTSGAAMVEYIVLLGVVSIAVAAAIAGLGPTLLADYERARGILIAPIP